MKSRINPASFTLLVNQKAMESKISPVSFTFPINQKTMSSQINTKVFTPPINQKMVQSKISSQVIMPSSQLERDDTMYEAPQRVKLNQDMYQPTTNLAPKPVQPFQPRCHTIRAIEGKCPHGQTISCVACLQSTLDDLKWLAAGYDPYA